MGILDELKLLRDAVKRLDQLEARNELESRISAVQLSLIEAADRSLGLQQDNEELRQEVSDMKERLANREKLIRVHNAYAIEGEPDIVRYCTGCSDNNGKLIRLLHQADGLGRCPVCKAEYYDVFE